MVHAGIVTTLVSHELRDRLLSMAQELRVDLSELPEPPVEALVDTEAADVEATKKNLDDLFNLL